MKRFSTFALLSAGTAAAAVAVTFGLALEETVQSAALLAIALSASSGGLALLLKRRALMKRGLTHALAVLAGMFAVRGLLLGIGLTAVHRAGSELAFVAAFFAVYFVQQTLELSWVVVASKELKGVPAT